MKLMLLRKILETVFLLCYMYVVLSDFFHALYAGHQLTYRVKVGSAYLNCNYVAVLQTTL